MAYDGQTLIAIKVHFISSEMKQDDETVKTGGSRNLGEKGGSLATKHSCLRYCISNRVIERPWEQKIIVELKVEIVAEMVQLEVG